MMDAVKRYYGCISAQRGHEACHGVASVRRIEWPLAGHGSFAQWLAGCVAVAMEASEATGDLGGPPRLARWHEARKAESAREWERLQQPA